MVGEYSVDSVLYPNTCHITTIVQLLLCHKWQSVNAVRNITQIELQHCVKLSSMLILCYK